MRKIVSAALAAGLMFAGSTALSTAASAQAYSAPSGLAGNQNWTGTLGLNFDVNAPVRINSIGVFDSESNGLSSALNATIYDRTTGLALFAPVTFASGTANPGGSAYIFQSITPLVLAAGSYQIAAWGYGAEPNYNYGFVQTGNGGPISFDSLGGRLTAVGSAYSSSAGVFATIPDDGTTRYGAGSFSASAVPEPATWAMMLVGFGAVGGTMRRRKAKVTTRVAYA